MNVFKSGLFYGIVLTVAGFGLASYGMTSHIPTPWGSADLSAIAGTAGIILVFLNVKTSASGHTAANRIKNLIKRNQ